MMIVNDSDVELTPDFRGRVRHGRAVTGRGTATADHRRRAPKASLQESFRVGQPTPVVLERNVRNDERPVVLA